MSQERRKEALEKLRKLRNEHIDLEAREEKLKGRFDTLEADSLAASEKLEMLQSRLSVATADLQIVETSISDTKAGLIAKGKLKGLPNPQAQAHVDSEILAMKKLMMSGNHARSRIDDGTQQKSADDSIEIRHKTQKCTFTVNASYKFRDLIQDATRYWDLPEKQCVVVSKDIQDVDAQEQVWPNEALVKFELDRMQQMGVVRPQFMLVIKPEDVGNWSDIEEDNSSDDEEESEASKIRREKRRQIENPTKKQTIKELLIYVVFVALWLRLLMSRRNVADANEMVSSARSALYYQRFGEFSENTFMDIQTTDDLFDWFQGPVRDALFVTEDYNNVTLPEKEQYRVRYHGMPVGTLELKQYRVTNHSCALRKKQLNKKANMTHMYYIPDCYGFYSKKHRATANYGPKANNLTAVDDNSGFTYHFKTKGEYSIYISGKYGSYPSNEAYIKEIQFGNEKQYQESIFELYNSSWIDRGTRAIIVSLLLYEPNFDTYVASQFIIEQVGSGLFYPSATFKVVKMDIFTNWWLDYSFMVIELAVYTFIAYYFLAECLEIRLYWQAYGSVKPYFSFVFNITDWAIITLQCSAVIIRVLFFYNKIRRSFTPFHDLANVNKNLQSQQATKLQNLAVAYDLAFQLDAVLICIMFFKFFKFFNLSPNLMMLWHTILRAMKDIGILTFMAILLFLGFATMANNLFGSDIAQYSTVTFAFSTLLQILIGVFDYEEMVLVDRVWCRVFFSIYVIFMFFIMLNVFLAILNDSYLAERKLYLKKYGLNDDIASSTNVKNLAKFLVLYAKDKNRTRKLRKYEKHRDAQKAKQKKIEVEERRRAFIEEKKKKQEIREAEKEKMRLEEEAKKKRIEETTEQPKK